VARCYEVAGYSAEVIGDDPLWRVSEGSEEWNAPPPDWIGSYSALTWLCDDDCAVSYTCPDPLPSPGKERQRLSSHNDQKLSNKHIRIVY